MNDPLVHSDIDLAEFRRAVKVFVGKNEYPICGIAILSSAPGKKESFDVVGGCPMCQVFMASKLVEIVKQNLMEKGFPPAAIMEMFTGMSKLVSCGGKKNP
jgi:hypothetical protein